MPFNQLLCKLPQEHSEDVLKKNYQRAGEAVCQIRELVDMLEDQSLIPGLHITEGEK